MFSLQEQAVKLTSFNPRAELHGEDRVPAADLGFEVKLPNTVLAEFHQSLRGMLYKRPDQPDLADDGDHMPDLRFPEFGTLKWNHDYAGYETTIHWGASGKDNIVLSDCEVDKFKFECQNGGTVVISFRVVAHPTERDMGRLCSLIQQDVDVTLQPPAGAQ